jgi:hypothetical protein
MDRDVPLDSESWAWERTRPAPTELNGRTCVVLEDSATVTDAELVDGVVEADIAIGPERGFHGVVWRQQDDESFESFFVRPHQVGNPDAIQYTPVFNGISSWQLYHGPGFWAPISFPIGDWFTIRVVFAGTRAEVYVADLETPALEIGELKRPVEPGRVGVFAGGPAIHLARFAYDPSVSIPLHGPAPRPVPALEGIVPVWHVSDTFPEDAQADALPGRTWTRLASEPTGLADLSRVNGIRDGKNTVFARAVVRSSRAQTKAVELGFSDRAVVSLNGRALYGGDYAYRSRDYRFLGSVGYFDTLYLELEEGDNELVVAVSEDLGGWGVLARFPDPAGLELSS